MSNLTVKWVKESDNDLAFHPECTELDGPVVAVSRTSLDPVYEPVFCYACRGEIGYYNPLIQVGTIVRLQQLVERAFRNALENGYEKFMRGDSGKIAIDMMDNDAEIAELAEEHDLPVVDITLVVSSVREKLRESKELK